MRTSEQTLMNKSGNSQMNERYFFSPKGMGIRSVNSIVIILEFFPAPTLTPTLNMLLSFVKNMSFLWRFNACSRYNE